MTTLSATPSPSPVELVRALRRDLAEARAAAEIIGATKDPAVAASHALAFEAAKERILDRLARAESMGLLAGFEEFLDIIYGN